MKRSFVVLVGVAAIALGIAGLGQSSLAHDQAGSEVSDAGAVAKPILETLLSAELEGHESTDVIVSRVTIPPNVALPRHWHPGEEFAYVLEGSVVLWQEGKEDIPAKRGDAVKVPLRHVHTAIAGDEGATILVFRVHERGQPERVLAD